MGLLKPVTNINLIFFLMTAWEVWDTFHERVTNHELLATRGLVHHCPTFWSESIVNETFFVSFEDNVTVVTVSESAIVSF